MIVLHDLAARHAVLWGLVKDRAPLLHAEIGGLHFREAYDRVRLACGLPATNGGDSVPGSINEMVSHILATDWRE